MTLRQKRLVLLTFLVCGLMAQGPVASARCIMLVKPSQASDHQ